MSQKKFFFMAGLPRSGGRLLASLLAQNPALNVKPVSALADIVVGIKNVWAQCPAHKAKPELKSKDKLRAVLLGSMWAYYNDGWPNFVADGIEGNIDCNDDWLQYVEVLEFALGEKPKIIVPVRSLTEIVASYEKLYRSNMSSNPTADNEEFRTTTSRSTHLMGGEGFVGKAFNRLKDAMLRGNAASLHFVEYYKLCSKPEQTLRDLYGFLELGRHDHDLKAVETPQGEDTMVMRGYEYADLRSEVSLDKIDATKIIGVELVKQLTGQEFWRK